jgi:hypothetical protein
MDRRPVIIAVSGDVRRFPTKHHFASYTGTAPIDVSLGDNNRHRLSRSGNRRLNWAIHIRCDHPDPQPDSRTRLLRPKDRRGQDQTRSTTSAETPDQRRRVETTPTRPRNQPSRAGSGVAAMAIEPRHPPALQVNRHPRANGKPGDLRISCRRTRGVASTKSQQRGEQLTTPPASLDPMSSTAHPGPTTH